MTLNMRASGRPLPQPPLLTMDREAAWYEHEERMRPSYIAPPPNVIVAAAQYFVSKASASGPAHAGYNNAASGNGFVQPPPLSPSSRWASPPYGVRASQQPSQRPRQSSMPANVHSTPSLSPSKSDGLHQDCQQLQHVLPGSASQNGLSSGAYASPMRLYSSTSQVQGSRFGAAGSAADGYRPFNAPQNEEEYRTSGGMKGSAFMHKGFFDILSLVNNPASRPAPNKFRATFSKATGRFRKDSNTGTGVRNGLGQDVGNEDPFFSSPAPPLQAVNVNALHGAAPLQEKAKRVTMPAQAAFSSPPVVAAPLGPRAAKKRISIDMVSAPRLDTFVHAAHASDAEQAEEILHRWGRDNVGKIADPEWTKRCKAAMRVQAARNQAEAIAQIQAALHQESAFKENPRQLHIVNGTPSNLTNTTVTTATVGHSTLSGGSIATQRPLLTTGTSFERIAEEKGQAAHDRSGEALPASPHTPRRRLPNGGADQAYSPSLPPVRPNMLPRSNTQGTMLVVSPGPASAGQMGEQQSQLLQQQQRAQVPDYLQYQPVSRADDIASARRSSKAIDGLPGGGGGAGIDALFEARPTSMVVRDSIADVPRNLVGEELSGTLANHAGAALRPSLTTVEKSVAAKIYFENLYYGILKKPQARETRRAGLESELALLRIPEPSKQAIRNAWAANETEYLRDLRARVNVNSFSRLKTIGHGAFGVVALVREQGTGELYAMKQLRKADMLRKGQEGHVRAERDLMTSASASQTAKWIVKLVYSFQDVDHLYLIMEFMGGGDLLNLLIEKDIFAEDFARFYVAEMILAIHEAHRLGYIHRDIKPDNFLFTSEGHVKLADFGLCQSFHWAHDGAYYDQQRKNLLKKHGIDLDDSGRTNAGGARAAAVAAAAAAAGRGRVGDNGALNNKELDDVMSDRNEDGTPLTHVLTWRERNRKKIAYSVVGTNNYMAPEVLRGYGYDQSCDWWSLGVIVFEMLYGYPPFVSKSRHLTRQKILNWRQTLRFPPKPRISREAQDFVSRLICERDDRLGSQSSASVSRPNSLLQGSRQPSGFAATGAAEGKGGLTDGVEELMAHPWFRGVDWNTIHTSKAPFVPALRHPADTKHFEDDIEDEPLPAPGAAEAAKNGQPVPVEQARDPMLRDKAHGQHLLEMRKQLAFVGYTFKSPKSFDPKTQLTESKINAIERADADARPPPPTQSVLTGSRLRSMSM